jgi:hypothetical protein
MGWGLERKKKRKKKRRGRRGSKVERTLAVGSGGNESYVVGVC